MALGRPRDSTYINTENKIRHARKGYCRKDKA
ncbi:uncharacterized protein G2W53_001567 [Senna tora]|uniref:Uncharacterized protein n=1 Tax=Senna tora TaxID=362788 RepID=A0A834XGI4_9FABA|nr:uncharacterized protein G2W53_001567 [Senna tora]